MTGLGRLVVLPLISLLSVPPKTRSVCVPVQPQRPAVLDHLPGVARGSACDS